MGQTIEHQIKKYGTLPPKDFKKWAVICEHIIRHYTEGWADGFNLDMLYWEIWNEPDGEPDDSLNKKTWGGTKRQFFDFYEIAAKHLKKCFPHLKIGGPSLACFPCNYEWAEEFLIEMRKRNVPIDFLSWHIYCTEPSQIEDRAVKIREMLDENGYGNTKSILNEWNYVKDWEEKFVYSIQTMHGIKGAAFTMASMIAGQHSSIDMMMYYYTGPSTFNGAFDYYSLKPLKGYYPLKWYGDFYDMDNEIRCENEPKNIYTLCGIDKSGKVMCIVTNYSDDSPKTKDIKMDFGKNGKYEIYMLDEKHDSELICTTSDVKLTLSGYSCALIKEI